MPEGLKMFPEYLREAGYYTTNNSKEDYNFIKSEKVWDESSQNASYKNRKPDQHFEQATGGELLQSLRVFQSPSVLTFATMIKHK